MASFGRSLPDITQFTLQVFPLINYLAKNDSEVWMHHCPPFPISFQHFGECAPVLTFDGDLLALKVVQVSQQHLLPVTPVADEAQVRQGALR